jgi:hypothetical protein
MIKSIAAKTGLFLALAFSLFAMGCRAPLNEDNLKRLSNLEDLVSSAQNNVSWDETDLQQRVDSMKMKLDFITSHLKDSGDLKPALMHYTAIKANYQAYIQQAPAIEYDLDKYRQQIIQLKDSALGGKISNPAFEKRYNTLRPILITINKITEPLWYNVLSVEPDYTRQDRIITEKYKALGGK